MRHTWEEKKRRLQCFRRFLKSNPPRNGCSPRGYGYVAFMTGYNAAMNDLIRRNTATEPSPQKEPK